MSEDVVIRVEGLWKRYGPGFGRRLRALFRADGKSITAGLAAADRPSSADGTSTGPWALREVNLALQRGEVLGVIGPNGAGKSTLLKVLGGVTPPTQGRVEVRGRVYPMIELNAGVHLDLTGRENARFLGAVIGLSGPEVSARMPAIEAFCDLGAWFDRPLRTYSNGMLARLGFAVAVNVDADVLLIDEVLAVGDLAFQSRCLDRIEELHRSGVAIVLASHSVRQVERLCDRALWLDGGQAMALGRADEVVTGYQREVNRRLLERKDAQRTAEPISQPQPREAIVDILDVRLLDREGRRTSTFCTGSSLTVEVEYRAHLPVQNVLAYFCITTADSLLLSGFTSELDSPQLDLDGRGVLRCVVKDLPLLSGVYLIDVWLRKVWWGTYVGGGSGLATFSVLVPEEIRRSHDYGTVRLDVEWEPEWRLPEP